MGPLGPLSSDPNPLQGSAPQAWTCLGTPSTHSHSPHPLSFRPLCNWVGREWGPQVWCCLYSHHSQWVARRTLLPFPRFPDPGHIWATQVPITPLGRAAEAGMGCESRDGRRQGLQVAGLHGSVCPLLQSPRVMNVPSDGLVTY